MAQFSKYIPLLQQVEGGFQKHPDDPGNYNSRGELAGTNYGISARFYEGIIGRPPSEGDIKAITKAEAEQIYKVHFWDKCMGDDIRDQYVANTVVDHHVNAGGGVKLAQQVLNNKFDKNLTVDNGMGPLTLGALNSVEPSAFVAAYNDAREAYYRAIGGTFLNGWLIRLGKFAYEKKKIIIGTTGFLLLIGVGLLVTFSK